MSYERFISLPREAKFYRVSDFKDRRDELNVYLSLGIDDKDRKFYLPPTSSLDDGEIWVYVSDYVSFKNCFTNNFVYGFDTILHPEHEQYLFDGKKRSEEELKDIGGLNRNRHLRIMYSFLDDNLKPGEFAETITVLLEGTQPMYYFDTLKSTTTLTMEEMLNSPHPKDYYIDDDCMRKRIIRKV